MIKIRYQGNLTPGLHGQAIRRGRHTIVEFVPGLTAQQRRDALRRLRQQGRMGIGPELHGRILLPALAFDRFRAVFGQLGAIVRLHPAGSTFPVMVVSGAAVSLLLLSQVSIRIVHNPQAASGSDYAAPSASGSPLAPVTGSSPLPSPSAPSQPAASQPAGARYQPAHTPGAYQDSSGPAPGTAPSPGTSPAPSETSSSGGTTLTATAATTPPPAAPSSSPPGQPSPSPSPSAGSSGGTTLCVVVGPLGLCLPLYRIAPGTVRL